MNTIKIDKKQVKLIAHRGLSGIELENTNSSFVAAANRSYFGIETDVHLTNDGLFVLMHDVESGRVSDVNIHLGQSNYDDIRKIKLGKAADGTLRADRVVPDLCEYIGICKTYEKKSVLELKSHFTESEVKQIIDIISSYGQLENTIFISFNFNNLVLVRKLLPNQPIQFLTTQADGDTIENLVKYNIGIDIYFPQLNPENIKLLKQKGIEINCWTVDDPEDAKRLIEIGVDYITTDILE